MRSEHNMKGLNLFVLFRHSSNAVKIDKGDQNFPSRTFGARDFGAFSRAEENSARVTTLSFSLCGCPSLNYLFCTHMRRGLFFAEGCTVEKLVGVGVGGWGGVGVVGVGLLASHPAPTAFFGLCNHA